MMNQIELLAPAGSFQVMKACIAAGADAVYMGLPRFSARAFADNADAADYTAAVHYAHLHGKKLYLTLNTLIKEQELEREILPLLVPLYEAGLDGVIVQDLGLMKLLRREFPALPLHASTQAASAGPGSARFLKELGASRVVPARELSLSEIRAIKEESGLEVECFIHGALCYSYSGQCLFSSVVGGRSGNRGRCAQSCRMCYQLSDEKGRRLNPKSEEYLLSLKDLNTLALLPELIDAGADSLKIEGRMKKAVYAAGVTAVYRKYLDLYLKVREACGTSDPAVLKKNGYRVDPADEKTLFDLFNRNGFTDGYLTRQNGRDMVSLKEPSFREENEALTKEIKENYIDREHRVPVSVSYAFREGERGRMTIETRLDGRDFRAEAETDFVTEAASGRPANKADVEKQLGKLGDTGFTVSAFDGTIDGSVFLPVSGLNALRRSAVKNLEDEILSAYARKYSPAAAEDVMRESAPEAKSFSLRAVVSTEAQLESALSSRVRTIVIEPGLCLAAGYGKICEKAHARGKECFLAFPQVFRARAEKIYTENLPAIRAAAFDGFLVRSLDAMYFVKNAGLSGRIVSDYTLYAFNREALSVLKEAGVSSCTASVELSGPEIRGLGDDCGAVLLYGYLPMMASANCLLKTTSGCDHGRRRLTLTDRMGNRLPVVCDCDFCMNRILNAVPLSLLSLREEVQRLPEREGQLSFTLESGGETGEILSAFEKAYLDGQPVPEIPAFTRGHFRKKID